MSEQGQGGVDLNGDGDTLDRVLHILPQSAGPILNVGLASDDYGPMQVGNTVALAVSETSQGGVDLNGDGNTVDNVLHLVDATTGVVTNTGLAVFGGTMWVSEGYVAFAVSENAQGIQDLNGDGDALDKVVHVVEVQSGAVTNYGLSVLTSVPVVGDVAFARVYEHAQSQDLNGDGDTDDFVLHVIDAAQGAVHNLGVDSWPSVSGISAGRLAYRRSEAEVGVDLNGDADLDDYVVHVVDAATGGSINTGLATTQQVWLDGPHLVVAVSEEHQGADLNLDGDEEDQVPFVRHVPTGAVTNTKLAVTTVSGLHGRLLTLHVSEWHQGGQDLNGDGDVGEPILHTVDVSTGVATNVGLHAADSTASARMVAFLVREAIQGGQDLNGDGDKNDLVWHAYDAWTGVTTNLGAAASAANAPRIVEDDFVVYVGTEFDTGPTDLNGDGDVDDDVVFLLRAGGSPQNLGVALGTTDFDKSIASSGRRVLLPVDEASQGGTDLNGDGDTADQVVHVVDVP